MTALEYGALCVLLYSISQDRQCLDILRRVRASLSRVFKVLVVVMIWTRFLFCVVQTVTEHLWAH